MIELKNIVKSFGPKTVLHNLNVTIYPDELTFIVGTSGAGKTTLLNIIGGLSQPDSGEMFVDGKNVLKSLNSYRADSVGFLFQDYNLISGLSVEKNVLLGQYISGNTNEDSILKTSELLSGLGIDELNQKAETLSGGEKQRAAFARCIMKKSHVIIADEPTGNLDSDNADKVLEILAQNKAGRHIIVVTHDMEKARKYADRILEIKDGEIISDSGSEHKETAEEAVYESIRQAKPMKLKAIRMLGHNSVRRKAGKLLSMILVIALAITALTSVFSIRDWGNIVSTRVNKYYLETDVINIQLGMNTVRLYSGGDSYPFEAANFDELSEMLQGAVFVPEYYLSESSSFMMSSGDNIADTEIKQVLLNSQFKDRIMSYDIEGRFPVSEEEIIISSTVSDALFSGGGIGEEVSLLSGNGSSGVFTVVGINRTENPFGSIYSVVSADALKSMLEEEIMNYLSGSISLSRKTDALASGGGIKGRLIASDSEVHLYAGDEPYSDSEIIISSFIAENVFGKEWKDKTEDFFSTEYWLDINGRWTVRICGVFESDDMLLKCSQSLLDSLKKADPVCIDVYLPDSLDTGKIYQQLNAGGKYFCTYNLEKLKNQIGGQTQFFQLGIILIGMVLSLVSILLLNSFSKITILERKREMGIIKSLGADNGFLMEVLMYDSFIIALASLGFSGIMTFASNKIFSKVFASMDYVEFAYPWKTELIIGGIFVLLIIICTSLHFIKIARMMPTDLLTDK